MELRSLTILKDDKRTSSLDVFRGIAILSVVIFHFGYLPYGYLGVNLFFVISGILIGGILINEFDKGVKINFFKFLLSRGFKIWPSYYVFLILGNILVYFIYGQSHPEQIIEIWDFKRYIFFYQNYTGEPYHKIFDVVWSLCVEEHFYILLPILLIIIQFLLKPNNQMKYLLIFILVVIIMGTIFKFLSFYFTNGKDTIAGTQNNIDALGWGVLFSYLLKRYGLIFKSNISFLYFIVGFLFTTALIVIHIYWDSVIYAKILFTSLIPIGIFFMILGLYYIDFSKFLVLRFIAYYSYNWYLWHCFFLFWFYDHIGKNIFGLLGYLIISFCMAMFFTIFIEEKALSLRKVFLKRVFN